MTTISHRGMLHEVTGNHCLIVCDMAAQLQWHTGNISRHRHEARPSLVLEPKLEPQ